jgi:glycosyltransferase involved in cell wall biosynthesis
MNKRRVVFVVPSLQMGGAERQVVDLVNHLDDARFDGTLFTFEEPTDLAGNLRQDHVHAARIPRKFKLDARPIAHLANLIRTQRIQLVHCTLQVSLLVARAAIFASGCTVRLIDALHSTKSRGLKEEIADRFLYVKLMRACDKVITVCDAQREYWAAKYPSLASKMVTVHNGIELEHYRDDVPQRRKVELRRQLGLDERELVLAMVAAIRPEKNHMGVLDALSRIVRAGLRVRLLCLGGAASWTTALEAQLHARTRALGLQDTVRWLGNVRSPKEIVSVADAVVMFSRTESLPMALLEALAMGKPVIASDVGGIPEVVEHEANGLLVPSGDVDALATALGRLSRDRALLRQLAVRARPSVEARFSVDEMARRTQDVMLAVLDGGAREMQDA